VPDLSRHRIRLVGMHGGRPFGEAAEEALRRSTLVFGARRHLDCLTDEFVGAGVPRRELGGELAPSLRRAADAARAGETICILTSGDPGFFGLARLACEIIGPEGIEILPAPPSVSLAFARLGMHWDDAVVVSAHGRDPGPAVDAVLHRPKVAVLASPPVPPQELGRLVLEAGCGERHVAVLSRLGEKGESRWEGEVGDLAAGEFDPVSVVVFWAGSAAGPGLAWGLPEERFEHRAGMITKSEVRAVALGKLALPRAGVLWDVGAGSGSVAWECQTLAPGLAVYAVERRAEDVDRLRRNVAGTAVHVVQGEAPVSLAALPDPDRVFVGGGGIPVLDAALARLRPGGKVVATFASIDRAATAARRLGHLVQVSISRALPAGPSGSLRLAAENPVFVCWGPD
jgi:precorrin-6B C5,15-methyltransferase / cobalt-precorrin-6B C5,C15-methyltransferase